MMTVVGRLTNKKNNSQGMTELKGKWTSFANVDASNVEANVEELGTTVSNCLLASGRPVNMTKQVNGE